MGLRSASEGERTDAEPKAPPSKTSFHLNFKLNSQQPHRIRADEKNSSANTHINSHLPPTLDILMYLSLGMFLLASKGTKRCLSLCPTINAKKQKNTKTQPKQKKGSRPQKKTHKNKTNTICTVCNSSLRSLLNYFYPLKNSLRVRDRATG